jgi:hypothetical protein
MKLAGDTQILAGMAKLGVRQYVPLLGAMEVAFAGLFAAPATFRLGFALASSYFGGAIATELSHGALTLNPFIMIGVLWVGAFIRDRSIFFDSSSTAPNPQDDELEGAAPRTRSRTS